MLNEKRQERTGAPARSPKEMMPPARRPANTAKSSEALDRGQGSPTTSGSASSSVAGERSRRPSWWRPEEREEAREYRRYLWRLEDAGRVAARTRGARAASAAVDETGGSSRSGAAIGAPRGIDDARATGRERIAALRAEIVWLYRVEGSIVMIVRELGVPAGVVRRAVARAREREAVRATSREPAGARKGGGR